MATVGAKKPSRSVSLVEPSDGPGQGTDERRGHVAVDTPKAPQVFGDTTDVATVSTADVAPVYSNTHDLSIQKAQIRHAKPLPPPFKSSSRPPLPEPPFRVADPEYANVALSVSERSSAPC